MRKIALTGNMFTGKTLCLNALGKLQINTFDLDAKLATIYQEKDLKDLVQERFGYHPFKRDGSLDIKKIEAIIIGDEYYRFWWHKLLYARLKKKLEFHFFCQESKKQPITIVAAAMLLEANWQNFFDEVWLVYSKREDLLERVQAGKRINKKLAEKLLKTQRDDRKKRPFVQVIINNYGTIAQLEQAALSTAKKRLH